MEHLKLSIKGMTCGHCKNFVTNILKDINGVKSVDVSLEKNLAELEYDNSVADKNKIIAAVNDSHAYTATEAN